MFDEIKFSFSCSKCFSFSSQSPRNQGVQTLQNVHAFSYNELKVATNGFRSSNNIGKGGFGSVYKGVLEDGRVIAVKVLSQESKQGDREFMAEIASMSNINHENLLKLYGGCVNGSCSEKNRVRFSWKLRREVSIGIARGLAYIHEDVKPHIVHRDIKSNNILLDHNFIPKISDFGLSKLFSDNITHISTRVAGTLGYLSPEYAFSGRLTKKSDIYSFSMLLLEIVTGSPVIAFDVELGEYDLIRKVWDMYKINKLQEIVDPMLNGNYRKKEALAFLKVGLLCVQEVVQFRPKMSMTMRMMNGEIDIDGMHISQPGLLTDIFDVKV